MTQGPAEAAGAAPRCVVVAEDDPVTRQALARQLAQLGLAPVLADSARSAGEAWAAHRPAVMLLDCDLAGDSGYALARLIRDQDRQVLLVAVSGRLGPEHIAQCERAGIDLVLAKPVSFTALGQLMEWLLPGSAAAPAPRAPSLPADELDGLYQGSVRQAAAEAREALATLDTARLARIAHRAHGAAMVQDVRPMAAAAARLQRVCGTPPVAAAELRRAGRLFLAACAPFL